MTPPPSSTGTVPPDVRADPNAENKARLTASRARVVATADETRRRLQRDVHDSAQQRLVHTIIALKLAREAIADGSGSAADLVDEELRDVVHEILPAALTRGGLRAGLESLVVDFSLPIKLDADVPLLAGDTETTAYFVVAEALANVVRHARADTASVELAISDAGLHIGSATTAWAAPTPARAPG